MAKNIEQAASAVLEQYFSGSPPVDLFAIAHDEGILLVPGQFTNDFCGRIEYHPKQRTFLLFHPDITTTPYPNRVRFSVGHELGHYFLDHHRARLIAGATHSSTSGFVSEEPMEREADEFAAALLIPEFELRRLLARRNFVVLADILALADRWQTSAISAAIRYVKYAAEACTVVLSEKAQVVFSVASEEARALGLGFVPKKSLLPNGSASTQAWKSGAGTPVGKSIASTEWMPAAYRSVQLWEEAVSIGSTDWTLTLLALDQTSQEEDR